MSSPARSSLRTGPARPAKFGPGAARFARQHWLAGVLLVTGLALRMLAMVAYRPALIYIDSLRYLYSPAGADPVGYWALLRPATWLGGLGLVVAAQHALGLAMAVTLYAVALSRGVPRWLAALACAPVLLDGYQLQLEQTVMPDVLFEALMVAGLAALAWRATPSRWLVLAGGLALGASATVRQVGLVLLLPALAYLLAAASGWLARLRRSGLLVVAFALPVLAYCAGSAVLTGHFWLSYAGGNELYGRLVTATGCAVPLPAYERPLCPGPGVAARLGGIDGLDHNPGSPLARYRPPKGMAWSPLLSARPPAGMTWPGVVADLDGRLVAGDPLGVARALGRSALTLFAVNRDNAPGDTPIARWQFQRAYPFYPEPLYSSKVTPVVVRQIGQRFGGGGPAVAGPVAAFLHGYQRGGGYTPGPLLALAALAGLAGAAAGGWRRGPERAALAAASLLFAATAVAVLGVSDAFEFSWRYQLPALVTLPLAGALGATAWLRAAQRRRAVTPSSAGPGPQVGPRVAEPGERTGDHGS